MVILVNKTAVGVKAFLPHATPTANIHVETASEHPRMFKLVGLLAKADSAWDDLAIAWIKPMLFQRVNIVASIAGMCGL